MLSCGQINLEKEDQLKIAKWVVIAFFASPADDILYSMMVGSAGLEKFGVSLWHSAVLSLLVATLIYSVGRRHRAKQKANVGG